MCHPTNSTWNFLSIPKGLLDENEDIFSAAKRELYEETSIVYNELTILKSVQNPIMIYPSGKKQLESFSIEIPNLLDTNKMNCLSMVIDKGRTFPEVDKFYWMTKEQIINSKTHITQIEIIKNDI